MRWLVLAIVGCSSAPGATLDAAPGTDSIEIDAPGAPTWLTVTPVANNAGVIENDLTYASGSLVIHARECRPNDGVAHPLAIYNHGGFLGLAADPEASLCEQTAQFGYVWLGSSYRGEDGSTGSVEVCLGEVDDVLAMLAIARTQPYVNADKVVMYGGSHGGCITLRALQRGAPIVAAADLFGPTDWTALDNFWHARIDANDPLKSTYQQLSQVLEQAAGGTPAAVPTAYDARSPLHFIADVPAALPIFVAQGAADTIVPDLQSCNLAAPLATASYHDDGAGHELATAPAGCDALAVIPTPRPTSWPGARYLVVYDGLGHETQSAAAQVMLQDVAGFLMARLN